MTNVFLGHPALRTKEWNEVSKKNKRDSVSKCWTRFIVSHFCLLQNVAISSFSQQTSVGSAVTHTSLLARTTFASRTCVILPCKLVCYTDGTCRTCFAAACVCHVIRGKTLTQRTAVHFNITAQKLTKCPLQMI